MKAPLVSEAHERGIIAAILHDPGVYGLVQGKLTPKHFTLAPMRAAWEAIGRLVEAGQGVHIGLVADALDRQGIRDAVAELTRGMDGLFDDSSTVEEMADVLDERLARRRVHEIGRRLSRAAQKEEADARELYTKAIGYLGELEQDANGLLRPDLSGAVEECRAVLQAPHEAEQAVMTGLPALDRVLRLRPGQLVMIEGRTSEGKSAFAQQVQAFNARLGLRVACRTLEMTRFEMMLRAVAQDLGLPVERFESRAGYEEWQPVVDEAMARIGALPWAWEDEGRTDPGSILGWLSRMATFSGQVHVAAIDYIQLASFDGEDIRRQLSDFGKRLKHWAKARRSVVLALAQLTDPEPGRKPEPPRLGQIRDCRDLEMHADIVLAIHRPGKHASAEELAAKPELESEAWIGVLKQRGGWTGWVRDFIYDGPTFRFIQKRA